MEPAVLEPPAYEPFDSKSLLFRPATLSDLDRIYELEAAGYPSDEAASREKLEFRIENAPELFLVATSSSDDDGADRLVAYVCSTRSTAKQLTHDSMSKHEPEGSTVCIHSVCVDKKLWRNRIASRLLSAYLRLMIGLEPTVESVRLICKEDLVNLYEVAGFYTVGPSKVVHGQDPWLEMACDRDEFEAMYG